MRPSAKTRLERLEAKSAGSSDLLVAIQEYGEDEADAIARAAGDMPVSDQTLVLVVRRLCDPDAPS
jgi:hypothetical protein